MKKYGSSLGKNWNDFDVTVQKNLKEKIIVYVEDIIDNLKIEYEEIFRIKADSKGKDKAF